VPRYRLTISYDGTAYAGWQIQKNGLTIQECLEKVLARVLQHKVSIMGSGRTDSGVHALGQVAHFDTEKEIIPRKFLYSLNGLLPPDIRVHDVTPTHPDFHARFTAKRKIYHYHLHLDPIRSPFKRKTSFHVHGPIDLDLLYKALPFFIGTRDFRSFTNQAKTKRSTMRTLYRLDAVPEEGGLRLEFEGNGFLYGMVRNITGTLVDIAQKKIPLDSLEAIFSQKDRSAAREAAPPEGLFLYKVFYEE
jgi:tRNA pseudouridine38-40 synthase